MTAPGLFTSTDPTPSAALVDDAPIVLRVLGEPRPKGSKTAIVRNGRAHLVESKSTEGRRRQSQWADDIRRAAQDWRNRHPGELLDEALAVSIIFYLPRPKSTPRRVKFPTKKPDHDKLCRLVCDVLKGVIYRDDSLIVRSAVEKQFADERTPGCLIMIERLS